MRLRSLLPYHAYNNSGTAERIFKKIYVIEFNKIFCNYLNILLDRTIYLTALHEYLLTLLRASALASLIAVCVRLIFWTHEQIRNVKWDCSI
jgi:hypothetical protein